MCYKYFRQILPNLCMSRIKPSHALLLTAVIGITAGYLSAPSLLPLLQHGLYKVYEQVEPSPVTTTENEQEVTTPETVAPAIQPTPGITATDEGDTPPTVDDDALADDT